MCLNKLKFRMKNMKSIAWQAGCLLWLGMAVCNCTPASSGVQKECEPSRILFFSWSLQR